MEAMEKSSYTRRPVTMEAIKVPRIANVIIAPKFEKNGFYKRTNIYLTSTDIILRKKGLSVIQYLLVLS
jgi:hypothetical protein